MRGGRTGVRSVLCILVLAMAACADTRYAADYGGAPSSANLRVAVIPLENLTNYPQAGLIVAELLATALYADGRFALTEGTALRKALAGRGLDTADLASSLAAAELARALEVDAVMVGSVTEFGYQHGLHEEPVVGVNLRLVGAGGEVLWAASHSTTGRGYITRDSVNAAAQRLLAEMVAGLDGAARAP